jgi:hypothetical protein
VRGFVPFRGSLREIPFRGILPLAFGYWLLAMTAARVRAATDDLAGPDEIPPLRPPKPEITPGFWEQHGLWVVLGGVVLIALMGWLWRALSRPTPPEISVPGEAARAALRPLAAAPEDAALFASVSGILRCYFVAALDLPRAELTNSELCRALVIHPKVEPGLSDAATRLLSALERRRFADPESGGAWCSGDARVHGTVVETALALVEQTEQALKPLSGGAINQG